MPRLVINTWVASPGWTAYSITMLWPRSSLAVFFKVFPFGSHGLRPCRPRGKLLPVGFESAHGETPNFFETSWNERRCRPSGRALRRR